MRAIFLSTLVLTALISYALRSWVSPPRAAASSANVAATWSATSVELATWAGLEADYQQIDRAIAPVVSSVATRAEVIRFVAARMDARRKTVDEFLAAARVRGGVSPGTALLFDGVSWVTTR